MRPRHDGQLERHASTEALRKALQEVAPEDGCLGVQRGAERPRDVEGCRQGRRSRTMCVLDKTGGGGGSG